MPYDVLICANTIEGPDDMPAHSKAGSDACRRLAPLWSAGSHGGLGTSAGHLSVRYTRERRAPLQGGVR